MKTKLLALILLPFSAFAQITITQPLSTGTISGTGSYAAGAGLSLTGTTFSLSGTGGSNTGGIFTSSTLVAPTITGGTLAGTTSGTLSLGSLSFTGSLPGANVQASGTGNAGVSFFATDAEIQTGTDTEKAVRVSGLSAWWTWVKTQAATIAGTWNFSGTTATNVFSATTSNITSGTTGTHTVTGNQSVNGNTTLGDAAGDSLTINAATMTAPNVSDLQLPAQTNTGSNSAITRSILDDWRTDPATQIFRDEFVNGGRTTGIIGETGWNLSGTGAGSSAVERGGAGVYPNNTTFRFTSGTTSTNYVRGSTLNALNVGNFATFTGWHCTMIFAPVQTTNCLMVMGISGNPLTDFADKGIGVRFLAGTDTNYQFFTKNDILGFATTAATTLVDSTVAPVANMFVKVEIRCVVAGTIQFRINGGNWLSSSTNIPTVLSGLFYIVAETRTSSAAAIDVDFVAWRILNTGR